MFILAALATLTFWPIVLIGIMMFVIIFGISLFEDKDDFNVVAFFGFIALIFYGFFLGTGESSLDIPQVFKLIGSTVTTKTFWEYVGVYFGAGALYFFPQTWFTIRKAARKYADAPAAFFRYKFIRMERKDVLLEPVIDKPSLAYWMSSWVVYWPFYLVSLVLSDLFRELARWVVDRMHGNLTKITKKMFADAVQT